MAGAQGVPTLLAVAHGTRDPGGPAVVRALLERVRAHRPWLPVAEAYAELAEPSLEAAARRIEGPVVAVPMMLARGYHALIDIPGRVERLCPRVVTAGPLGPHMLLAAATAGRLAEGVRPRASDAVVLGAAGSSDPAGMADVRTAARLLSRRLRRPVPYGFVAAGGPPLAEVVAEQRARGAERVLVASHLIAPGFFHGRMAASGADHVSAPIGAHDALARLVLRRFDEARIHAAAAVPVA
ncbi:CbiX/SirB N-terminal domain-containing protein [Actinomadura vinacea]|uniref:CbiX/SirB N-terminal domain-containing protein n=2 Tax=Actinomadura vinacea TaxID=115336 RepID=A0ABP5X1D2_9ACTN